MTAPAPTADRQEVAVRQTAPVSVIILTKNEELNLPHALASVKDWAAEVFVVDSGSTDATADIARRHGAAVVHHDWPGFAYQKNWALDHLPLTQPWVFILDADESLTPPLREELAAIAVGDTCPENGFHVNRLLYFMVRPIRHCGYFPSWNLRFFRRGKARYEPREVHEHMLVDGPTGYLRGLMRHEDRRGLDQFLAKHRAYAALEAHALWKAEHGAAAGSLPGSLWGGPLARRRWVKDRLWPKLPCRPLARWTYMYLLRGGFLDVAAGFHICRHLAAYERQIAGHLRTLRRTNASPADAQRPPR
jgi:glycosyltransferase involved in cell wall biosynthesis